MLSVFKHVKDMLYTSHSGMICQYSYGLTGILAKYT